MGASALRNKLKKAGIEIRVTHCAIEAIPPEASIVVTHEKLADRVRKTAPDVEIIPVRNYIQNDVYDILLERIGTRAAEK